MMRIRCLVMTSIDEGNVVDERAEEWGGNECIDRYQFVLMARLALVFGGSIF